ncbi:LuxR C-terminal-related transcriptional regulator (plasmid) [Streptomyces sp. AHU1]|uniref:helix-turn-helix transcriptional regulator n=1 Tax=Streptomyces sp. AHU1 TaxID=3377215 RepID=UPI003877F3EC
MTTKETTAASISILVRAADPVSLDGAEAYLRGVKEADFNIVSDAARANVVLVLANDVTDDVMMWIEEDTAEFKGSDRRIILVADSIDRTRLIRGVRRGLVSVLPRSRTDFQEIVQAVLVSHSGGAQIPEEFVRVLVEELRSLHQESGRNRWPGGLEGREIDVLRLLADGLDTTEIAHKLNYSERTIKNIVSAVTRRLNLRNRTHAVAYALRVGAL